jgi:hypothetical protein
MNPILQTMYGLKFHPFRPDVPIDALYVTPKVDSRVHVRPASSGVWRSASPTADSS